MTQKKSSKIKNVVIIGGSGYVGLELTKHFLKKKLNVIHIDTLINNNNNNNNYYQINADVTNRESLEKAALFIRSNFKKINILINLFHYKGGQNLNSNQDFFSDFENYSIDQWNKTLDVNLTGLFNVSQIFLKLLKNNNASIINFSSTYGLVSPRFDIYGKKDVKSPLAYVATKTAIIGMTKYLAVYFAKYNIRVNSISPGGIANKNHKKEFIDKYSKNTPLGRLMNAKELFSAIDYLSSEDSSYTTGSNVVVDGGWTTW